MADKSKSFPILTGDVVTQGHANYCAEHGHATHKVDGVDTGVCPRCGAVTTLKDRRGYRIDEIRYVDREVIMETGEIVGWDYCDLLLGAEHKGKCCDSYNRRTSPVWKHDATSVDGFNPAEEIYNADPFGNRAFYEELFGEETVNEMTNTGETTENTRDVFPRVTFREVQDAEMVAEILRSATTQMGKRAAQAIKVWGTQRALDAVGLESTAFDGNNKVVEPYTVIKEIGQAMTDMLEMVEAIAGQLANMYGTNSGNLAAADTAENANYIIELEGFVTETRNFVDAVAITADEYNTKKTGE